MELYKTYYLHLASFSKSCLKFTHVVACINSLFLLFNCMDDTKFCLYNYYSSWSFGLFHFLAIMSNAAMNINIQVFVWMCIFISLG